MCSMQATLQLTDAQQQDMLHLRRCLYSKVGQLSRERDAIMSSTPAAAQPTHSQPFQLDFKHTADKLAETKEWADALCTNRANESRAFVYAKICLSRGVSLTIMLHSVEPAYVMAGNYWSFTVSTGTLAPCRHSVFLMREMISKQVLT